MIKYYNIDKDRINYGFCFIWAYLVWALSNENLKFATDDGHVVIDDGYLYYDSQYPKGYPYLKKFGIDAENVVHVNVHKMAWYWTRCGERKKELRKILKKTHVRLYHRIRTKGFGTGRNLCVEDIP